MKRSNQPVFWLLFGAGGMLSALVGAALVLVTGLAGPLGWLGRDRVGYPNMLAFSQNVLGKAFILAVVSLFLWHAAHRVYHTLHDLGIRTGTLAWLCCYGVALAGTITVSVALLSVGF